MDFGDARRRVARRLSVVTMDRQALGARGEAVAERYLTGLGWRVLARRFRSGHRDIDLVVEREGTVAFVEVKARRGGDFGDAVQAVNWRKQRELVRSGLVWIDRCGEAHQSYRFDVIGVRFAGGEPDVHHVEDAFSVASRA